MKSKQKRPQ